MSLAICTAYMIMWLHDGNCSAVLQLLAFAVQQTCKALLRYSVNIHPMSETPTGQMTSAQLLLRNGQQGSFDSWSHHAGPCVALQLSNRAQQQPSKPAKSLQEKYACTHTCSNSALYRAKDGISSTM